jgi:hypothetical protein
MPEIRGGFSVRPRAGRSVRTSRALELQSRFRPASRSPPFDYCKVSGGRQQSPVLLPLCARSVALPARIAGGATATASPSGSSAANPVWNDSSDLVAPCRHGSGRGWSPNWTASRSRPRVPRDCPGPSPGEPAPAGQQAQVGQPDALAEGGAARTARAYTMDWNSSAPPARQGRRLWALRKTSVRPDALAERFSLGSPRLFARLCAMSRSPNAFMVIR